VTAGFVSVVWDIALVHPVRARVAFGFVRVAYGVAVGAVGFVTVA